LKSNTRKLILALMTTALLNGCGAYHDEQNPVSGGTEINAFAATVRPILQNNCFGCHATLGGSAGAAFFMNPNDDSQLYREAFNRITPKNPISSKLLNKAMGMGHSPGNQLPSVPDQDTIKAWINSESSGGSGTSGNGGGGSVNPPTPPNPTGNLVMTSSLPVPSNLSNGGAYQYLRFPLSGLGHSGALLEMGIRFYTDGGYEFSQWRVYSPNYPLKVTGLNIVVTNGSQRDFSNTLATVVLNAPKSGATDSNSTPLPGAVLSSRAATGISFGTGDLIQVGFTRLERDNGTTPGGNQEQVFFLGSVKPILLNRCASCHGNANGSGNFNMPNNDDTVLYQNVRFRVTPKDPNNSKLYNKGTGVGHGGGIRLTLQAEKDTIISWINMIQ
jgi:mono/diheme cytochrome c family protein